MSREDALDVLKSLSLRKINKGQYPTPETLSMIPEVVLVCPIEAEVLYHSLKGKKGHSNKALETINVIKTKLNEQ